MSTQSTNLRLWAQLLISLFLVYGAYWIARPFLIPVVTAVIFSLMLRPLYRYTRPHTRSDTTAALLCLLLVILVLLVPSTLLSVAFIREISTLSGSVRYGNVNVVHINTWLNQTATRLGFESGSKIDVRSYLLTLLSAAAGHTTAILGGVLGVVGDTVLVLFGLFYILQGSDRMRHYLHRHSPLQEEDTDLLLDRAQEVVQATVRGNLILMLLQGACFVLGCVIFGFKAPLVLGALYGLASMVPVVGTSIVWVPMLIFSLLTGDHVAGIGITIWAIAQIALIDHILGPRLIGVRTKLNPFLALIGIFGGIAAFGLLGFIIGPTIVALGVVGMEMLGRSWHSA